MSRRDFLGKASCAAVGSATLFSGLFNLKSMALLASDSHHMRAPQGDYRALVCILLAGGNDSYNMLVPTDTAAFQEYRKTRSNQSLKQNQLLGLSSLPSGQTLGLHPSMSALHNLYQKEDLAFVNNVGTLVQPIRDRQEFGAGAKKVPVGLFSHADQIMQWQTSVPQSRNANGWGGRLADLLHASNAAKDISMNISLSGNNVFQSGDQVSSYTISPFGTGSIGLKGYGQSDPINQIRTTAVNNLLEQQYQDIFKQTYADITLQGQQNHERFSQAVGAISLNTSFSPDFLAQSMRMVARTIAARSALDVNRQTFFITYGGWDHHDELLNNQSAMLQVLSDAMGQFQAAMKELGVSDQVTTFTISDFARTLTSNGNGTDHAWGGNAMVMGGAVKGGKMYGTYPSLSLNQDLHIGGGVLIPTTSTDAYFAELALWLGVSPSDLSTVLPNIGTFHDPLSSSAPLGFLL